MSDATLHVSVCICTFKRPRLLARLLRELERQDTGGRFTFSVVVADNDPLESGRQTVAAFASRSPIDVDYCVEPRQNIALARNRSIALARGNFIAFIDDDEFPTTTWLREMLDACLLLGVVGVLGPVRPHFEQPPPAWIIRGRFCERPEYRTGREMLWDECRTGNVLFRRSILDGEPMPFHEEFGNGGEDKDFFMRMMQKGHVFRWCNEGVAYETVPDDRWTRRYMLKRALLRGKNILKHPTGRARILATSVVAVPVYCLVLLPTLILGQHCFMKYCIKLGDHVGRLLALAQINPVSER
jgi:glycosyltransferase involved in cell wall biosynthesis